MSFADEAIQFNEQLKYTGPALPDGIRIMNPFTESTSVLPLVRTFYRKFYNDDYPRHLILGINPGRFGAALTGIPFTDPKRLITECGIPYDGYSAHETSSVFIYEMIKAYGGPDVFYRDFYINSVCPLGFTKMNEMGKEKNYNYYDSKELSESVGDFILNKLRTLKKMPLLSDVCFCFGTGKNEKYLNQINQQYSFFGKIVALEHPRFIMQYQAKRKEYYIEKYLSAFNAVKKIV